MTLSLDKLKQICCRFIWDIKEQPLDKCAMFHLHTLIISNCGDSYFKIASFSDFSKIVHNQKFLWGRGGGWGGTSSCERCLKWDGRGWGSFQKHLKTGCGYRQKLFVVGMGVLKVSPPYRKF